MGRLILVSNRLPVRIDDAGEITPTTGGLASALEGAKIRRDSLWIGWPGNISGVAGGLEESERKLATLGVRPVHLSEQENEGFYEGYASSTLWPLLHYRASQARFDQSWVQAYRDVNRRFADVVLEEARSGDIVWVHDYQLFLLPSMLRESGCDLRIGFFLHTPFPSSDVFRILPERAEILRGLLGADVIGFHTYNYLRHFRSALLRVLGVESDVDMLWVGGRTVRLRVYPIGHNHVGFAEAMASEAFGESLTSQAEKLQGRKLILSVERLDYTKGVPQKLMAIRRFLADHPGQRKDVVFILIAVPSRRGVREYDRLTEEVQREVGSINGEFGVVGHAPLQFLHRGFPPEELAVLYALADVCLVTPLIDGMNLVAKEFIDCQGAAGVEPGVLVLSEFAGAAQELSQAIMVNPYDEAGVARAIADALEMPLAERRARIDAMRPRVVEQDAGAWARRIIDDLSADVGLESGLALGPVYPLADRLAKLVAGGGAAALFLDYDGTLRDFTSKPEDAVPDPDLVLLLQRLAAVAGLEVTVVSGRPPAFLEEHFGASGLTLVAEHGYRWRFPETGIWELVKQGVDTAWKDVIRPHIEDTFRMTPGSSIEEKRSSIVWHYRQADPEFGPWRAHGLLSELTEMAANLPVTVHHGKKIVEVSSMLVSKGIAVDLLLGRWKPTEALAAGDDPTDESMFVLEPSGTRYHTLKVGSGPTRAEHRTDIAGLRELLRALDKRVAS